MEKINWIHSPDEDVIVGTVGNTFRKFTVIPQDVRWEILTPDQTIIYATKDQSYQEICEEWLRTYNSQRRRTLMQKYMRSRGLIQS